MTNEQSTLDSGVSSGTAAQRRLTNYLLDWRFQLKYTGYVVVVTLVVASVLGTLAYNQSAAQTEMLTMQLMSLGTESESYDVILQEGRQRDLEILLGIVGGVLGLTLALGVTGIMITHRVVGPAYKMKRLFQDVVDGHLRIRGRLRKGDELQDVFNAYEKMIDTLRARQREEISLLERGIEKARHLGVEGNALTDLEELRARMESALE